MNVLEQITIGEYVAKILELQPFSQNMESIFVAKEIEPSKKLAKRKT